MQNRVLIVGSLLLAVAVAVGPVVDAQAPQHTHERIGGCFTSVTPSGGAFLVTPGGATEKILRAAPAPAPTPASTKVKHSMPHSTQKATPATHKVQVRHTASTTGSTGCRLRLR